MGSDLRKMFPNSPEMFRERSARRSEPPPGEHRDQLRRMFPVSYESMTGRVFVVAPDGQLGSLPSHEVAEALTKGWRRL